jgi:putative acetyltransferase
VWTVHEAAFGRPDEARLVARLRQEAAPRVSLVAERGGRLIGHVIFSPVTVGNGAPVPGAGGLAPVGVLPEAQGAGAGAALIRAGLEAARSVPWALVFVLGNPTYYGRFGFGPAAPHGLVYGSGAAGAAFQVLELAPGALSSARGAVRYHAAFAALG